MERLRETLQQRPRQHPLLPQEAGRGRRLARRGSCHGDVADLPVTTKIDLRDHYPFGMFARPRDQIVRVHAISGTTGNPTTVGYTRADIATWGDLIARTLAAGGVKPGDLLQNAYGYGLFTGGLGLHFGAEHLGCTVVPISGGNTERQLKIMRDFGATALACTPSYAMYLGDAARDRGLRPDDLPIRVGFHGAEPWTNELRVQIEAAPRHRRPGHLRPLRDGRSRRRLRVPLQVRHARQRGPLPGRDHRLRRRCGRCPRASRASSCSRRCRARPSR